MLVVRCGSCGSPLTVPLGVVDADRIDLRAAGIATLPQGGIVLGAPAREVRARGGGAGRTVVEAPAGSVVVHPDDRLPEALRPVGGSGCCGLDGSDGPNQACACGAVLGTAWTDCWTANEVRFLPDAVTVGETG